jgi:peptidoglycan hydrolase-like protein with peptidoglycan-binding domain
VQRKAKADHLRHALKLAGTGTLILAGAMLCLPGWAAQSPRPAKKKTTVTRTASSAKSAAASSTKKTATGAKSSARGKSKRVSSRSSRREKGQKTPTPDRIAQIQQALGKDGAYASQPSGKWDASTVEAVKKFQTGHGLNPSGKLDAKTLQQLGLGSTTAGIAPPAPLVSPIDRLTGSSTQAERRP